MDGSRPDALTDAQLDRELSAAVGIEPSPEFLARVRMKVATEPEPPRWRPARWGGAVEPMWAAAIIGIVLTIVVPQLMRDDGAQVRPLAANVDAAPPADAGIPALKVPPPVTARPLARPAPPVEAEWGRTVPLRLSPVLFADDDARVFAMFVEAVGAGQVPEEAVRRPEERGEMEGLTIEPLEIAPLASFARTAREGEDQWE